MKNVNLIFVCIIFVMLNYSKAQNTIQKRIMLSKSNNAYSRDIIETTTGNFVLIGPSIDSIGNQLENKLSIVGVNSQGTVQWHKKYGSNKYQYMSVGGSYGQFTKKNNYVYAAFMARDSNNFYPATLIKINFNGDTIWQKKFYDSNPTAQYFVNAISPSEDNGLLITGAIQTNTPGFNNHPIVGLFLIKADLSGNKLWEKRIYKSNLDKTISGVDIVQDSMSKKIFVIGNEIYDLNGSGSNIMIFDSIGNLKIQKHYNSFFDCGLVSLIKSKDGNFIAGGTKGNSTYTVNGNSTGQSTLVKFDTLANLIFQHYYDTLITLNCIMRLGELSNGEIISGGSLEITEKYTNTNNSVCRIMKHDKNGSILWKKYFDNITDIFNVEFLSGLRITINNEIVFTSFALTTTVTPATFMFYRTDTSYCDVNAIGCYSYSTVGLNKVNTLKNEYSIYPNPTESKLTIQKQSFGQSTMQLQNSIGQIILNQKLEQEKTVVDLTEFPKGFYFLKLENESRVLVKKVIKE